jgi:hypothetical protein
VSDLPPETLKPRNVGFRVFFSHWKVKAAAAAERGRVERRAAVERGTPAAAAAFKDIPLAE